MRPQLPTMKEEKTIEKNVNAYSIKYLPSIFERGNGFLFSKMYVYRSGEIIKGAVYLFLGFQRFISEAPLKGPEKGEI